jgi:ADP-ribose pyrophosphatase YjhB (NUDIX family)
MTGTGPFLWLSKNAPPAGFREVPPGGMCLSVFLFVERHGQILLGKYKDDAKWEELAGLDPDRRRTHGRAWTVPASHLKFGEDPREAGRRIGEEILEIPDSRYSDPRSEVDLYESKLAPGHKHYDVWFFVDAVPPEGYALRVPPWYTDLTWQDPHAVPPTAYARGHEDVVERWLASKSKPGGGRRVARAT